VRGQAHRSLGRELLFLPPLLFLLLAYFYPLLRMLQVSAQWGALTWPAHLGRLIGFTAGQALLSTLLTLLLGLPGAAAFARYEFPGRRWLGLLTGVPFVLPTVVVAAAFNAVLGPRSPLNALLLTLGLPTLDLRYSLAAILMAHVFYNLTLVIRIVGTFWAGLDERLVEAARTLGASPLRAWVTVTLPLLLPALGAAALLTFIFCFTSFGVVLILGGPRFATLEVEIYRQTVQYLNLAAAAVLALIQLGFTLALTLIYTRLQGRLTRPLDLRQAEGLRRHPRRGEALALYAYLTLLLAGIGLPLLTLVLRSLAEGGQYYLALFENPRRSLFYVPPVTAVRNSLSLGLATTALALLLGLPAALALRQHQRGWLFDALLMLPLGTSAVTLGLGYLLSWNRPPLDLRGSPVLLGMAHTLVALPFVVRALLPALNAIRPALHEAAATLGAPPGRVFWDVDLPLSWRALLVGALFAFTISLGEFSATALLTRPDWPTIPIAIYRFLGLPGAANYGQAMAMATLLMAVCVLVFIVSEGLRPPESTPL